MSTRRKNVLDAIAKEKDLTEKLEQELAKAIQEFKKGFKTE